MRRNDQSYGIIPLRRGEKGWETLLVKHGQGHWAFPKGHADPGEEPHQAAVRELQEETGLEVVRLLEIEPVEENYSFRWKGDLIDKRVTYFLAEVEGKVVIQEDEISDCRWLTFEEAEGLATFAATQQLCARLYLFLEKV